MKIMNILTLRYLKANKKRSLLTLLCIMVSVIMMSCVGIAFSSGKAYYKSYIEKTRGDYHYRIVDNRQEIIDLIKDDSQVDEYYFSCTTQLDYQDSQLYMKSGDSLYFQKKGLYDYIIDGRLPVNKYEIVITPEFLKMNHIDKKIGDQITFDNQQTYTIVGFMNSYQSQDFMGDIYQAFSYIDLTQDYTMYIKDKDVSKNIFQHVQNLKEKIQNMESTTSSQYYITYNLSYLAVQNIFEEGLTAGYTDVYHMIYIMIGIISFVSVMIIYQAFHLSTTDRIQYLGMLSSVGATPKQKKCSVYFEGFILSIIAIPFGILCSFIGLNIAFSFANQMKILKDLNLSIHTQISPLYLCLVIIGSFLITFIALYIPARRISKISVMDALTKSDEVKVKKKRLQLNRFLSKFLNVSWQLSIKNYKRQGIKSRVIIISLMLSMIIFVSMTSFGKNFINTVKKESGIHDYDISVSDVEMKNLQDVIDILNNSQYDNDYYLRGLEFVDVDINPDYLTYESPKTIGIYIQCIDDQRFNQLCEDNGIQPSNDLALTYNQSLILGENETEISSVYKKMDRNFIQDIYISYLDEKTEKEKKIDIQNFQDIQMIETSDEYNIINPYELTFIVSTDYFEKEFGSTNIEIYIQTQQHEQLNQELESYGLSSYDETSANQERIEFMTIVEIFVYGFITILLIFTLLNILNMMSASIEKRKKEFAMFMSIGMSVNDMKKMLWKESSIYGIKSFVYSLPFCIIIEFLLYNLSFNTIPFRPSWIAYLISFIVMMIVMILTFKLGLNRFRKQNIIETLKDDM